jgi:PST family polysaccharide transporter
MFYRLEKILLSPPYKTLVENFLSLSFLQVANYIFPLITFPYLVRVLGPEKYGLIAFAQAFIGYFQILTDYGFNLSAPREISINRENKEKVSEIFSSVMILKFFLLLLSLGLMTIIVFSFKKFRQDWMIYYLTFGMVLGQTLFPIWFFQGMERMRYITFLNVLAKLIFTIAIFIFVKRSSDYLYVPLLNSLGFIVAGVLALRIVFRDFGVFFRIPSFKYLKYQLKEGWYIFISIIIGSIFVTSIPFITGLLTNNTIVGFYAAGEKIIKSAEGIFSPLSTTVYPHIAEIKNKSTEHALIFIKKLIKVVAIFTFIFALFLVFTADYLSAIVLGKHFKESTDVIRILSVLIIAKGIGHIFLIQTMLNFGYDKYVFKIVLIAGMSSIISSFFFIPIFLHIGSAISAVIPELLILILSASFVEKKFRLFKKIGEK